ncbi:MAG: hypothetical protein KDD11_22500, partial [Acidobacteria bacterium]|nr:hypothetical protein [Acidobacteriota bacterium]
RALHLVDFLSYRAAFCGVPYGEQRQALAAVTDGTESWQRGFAGAARRLHRAATAAGLADHPTTASRTWLAVAGTYQAASLGFHLETEPRGWRRRLGRWRRLARAAYARAMDLDPSLAEPVTVPVPGGRVAGYLRRSPGPSAGTVVLVNGLDSMSEVELHRFAEPFLERGFHTLALGLPDPAPACGGSVGPRSERAASAIVDWVVSRGLLGPGRLLAAFGVSFGGQVVARLMSGDPRFAAGVAVSPPAWIDEPVLEQTRFRRMLAQAFGVDDGPGARRVAGELSLSGLRVPRGDLLVLGMLDDALFGPAHVDAYSRWGGDAVAVREIAAEHVGTSKIHLWLPAVCDWCAERVPAGARRTA